VFEGFASVFASGGDIVSAVSGLQADEEDEVEDRDEIANSGSSPRLLFTKLKIKIFHIFRI
jgi:hypothetical protein